MYPEPLQPGQDRRQLVPTAEGQANLFDGRDLEIGLGLIMVTHGGRGTRMLQVQTRKPPRTFNHHANIRTDTPTPNPMPMHLKNVCTRPRIRIQGMSDWHGCRSRVWDSPNLCNLGKAF